MNQNTSLTDTGTLFHAEPTEQCKKPVMPGDYFFRGEKYPSVFIKLSESTVSKKELDQYLDDTIEIEFELKTGSWRERSGNPNANQTYMVLHAVKKISQSR